MNIRVKLLDKRAKLRDPFTMLVLEDELTVRKSVYWEKRKDEGLVKYITKEKKKINTRKHNQGED
jgi:hypothetical protein